MLTAGDPSNFFPRGAELPEQLRQARLANEFHPISRERIELSSSLITMRGCYAMQTVYNSPQMLDSSVASVELAGARDFQNYSLIGPEPGRAAAIISG